MKTVFVNRFFWPDQSATSQLVSDLAFHLAAQGREVLVITGRQCYEDPRRQYAPGESVRGVKILRLWTTRFGRHRLAGRFVDYLSFYVTCFSALLGELKRGDVVVAKTDPPLLSVIVAAAAKFKGAVLVNWLQDLFPEIAQRVGVRGVGGALYGLLKALRDASLRSAALNVAIGERMAQYLQKEGIDANKVRVIHNWVDGARITPTDGRSNPLRDENGFTEKFVLGYFGNMGRVHEFDTLLGAARQLSAQGNFHFLFVGEGALKERIRQTAAEARLTNISFWPYQPQENLSQSFGSADMHLVTLQSGMESYVFPSKLFGSLAAGRPVLYVGDADGGIAQLLRQEQCGFTAPVGDPAAVVRILSQLEKDPAALKIAGRNARSTFERLFDRSRALALWLNVLNETASKGSP